MISKVLNRFKTIANALRMISINEELFIKGKSFSGRDYFDIAGGAQIYMIFDPTDSGLNKIIFEPLRFLGLLDGPIYIDIYNYNEAPVGPVGDPLRIGNRIEYVNGLKSKFNFISEGSLNLSLLISANKLNGRIISCAALSGHAFHSGDSAGGLPFEVNPTMRKVIKIDNQGSGGAQIEYNFTFFEN